MPKRNGCQIGCLLFAALFILIAWHLWSLAVGKYEVLASFADDSSSMENAFPDFPTNGPIACHSYVIRFGVRVLAGRVDPAAFDAWAKQHYPPSWETWQADSDKAYDVWFKDEALLKRVGLPHLFERSGDTMTAFARSSKRLYHSLEVNITQGTFLYIASFTDGDGEEE